MVKLRSWCSRCRLLIGKRAREFDQCQKCQGPLDHEHEEGIGEEMFYPAEKYMGRHIGKLMTQYMINRDNIGEVKKAFHPMVHGTPRGIFKINEDIPKEYQVGIFAHPGKEYRIDSSFANSGPFKIPDTVHFGKSLAIKLYDVPGKKLQFGYEDDTTMDLLFNSGPAFFAADPAEFLNLLHYLMEAGDHDLMRWMGEQKGPASRLGQENEDSYVKVTNPLRGTYWSQAPFKFGNRMCVKHKVYPVDVDKFEKEPGTEPDFLKRRMIASLAKEPAEFHFAIQLQKDPETMPVEDASVVWDERQSPFINIAKIIFPRQDLPTEIEKKGHNAFFQPWLVTEDFRPLGALNRSRMHPYYNVGEHRQARNSFAEPKVTNLELDNELHRHMDLSKMKL